MRAPRSYTSSASTNASTRSSSSSPAARRGAAATAADRQLARCAATRRQLARRVAVSVARAAQRARRRKAAGGGGCVGVAGRAAADGQPSDVATLVVDQRRGDAESLGNARHACEDGPRRRGGGGPTEDVLRRECEQLNQHLSQMQKLVCVDDDPEAAWQAFRDVSIKYDRISARLEQLAETAAPPAPTMC